MILSLRVLGLRLELTFGPDGDDYPGPGASADVTLAPGFVPDVPWYDDED